MNRDCRGLCIQQPPPPTTTTTDKESNQQRQNNPMVATQSYQLDRCGFCSLSQSQQSQQQQSSPSSSSSVNDPNQMTMSQSMDCKGNCQLPGLVKHTIVCGQCINQQNEMPTVIDNCGHCLSEGHACSCDRYVLLYLRYNNEIYSLKIFSIVIQYVVAVLIKIIAI